MKSGKKMIRKENGQRGISFAFDDVSFSYKGASDLSLEHISVNVGPGQTLGVIGGTGSGKSSLVNLLCRFYDVTSGKILMNGQNIQDYSLDDLRKEIAIVPQKAQLFKGTIFDNLKFGDDSVSEDDMERALIISQAKEFVDTKEGGLYAPVEQGGRNLSGGQKQRLTLARAIARNAGLLIMDDSASALDFATDAKLRKALKEMPDPPTIVIVSQRASSMMHADQILVLDDGQMVGLGSHEELLEHCDVYQEIYRSQFE